MAEDLVKQAIDSQKQADEELGHDKILEILYALMDNGKLIIVGLGGHGKTTACMHIMKALLSTKEFQEGQLIVKINDSANVWKWKYDKIPYVDMTKTRAVPNTEKALILDLGYSDTKLNTLVVEDLVRADYWKQRENITKLKGKIPQFRIYVIEEIQNILGSYSMSGESGRFWLKIISEGRNFGIFMIGLTQRLADVSTKAIERSRYFLIGALAGDNDLNKIKRMLGSKGRTVVDLISSLKKGEFLWLDRENPENSYKITFPKFEQNGEPYEFITTANGKIKAERVFV